ncbi:4-(cytidine 5'-diphospho)-2-C-methyl-D-erythritol kinase [Roseococcus suduntuyensis]|uniref:4-diphosphocytidyl-2-C-methyl-D-erythritol kinase n=1 Tax=Roseococcus suduntuyensis TaxID=455361 RepID=A0A840AGL8_9PROT|nr:4-(cytidine 5'-diphospho)-2-C-methyl-D-erythritol kinase [Roseococcus suduntuyensis]MBB3899304.1 4-diphosphocytidyl-2-C-methyl-D-erythritol kinase [Roseococcus suduntuyensis]
MTLEEAAPAKVNLFLHVTGRRADGYHLLDSLAVFGPAADLLTATPAEGLSLALEGPFGAALQAEPDNLVLRAARALAAAAGVAPRAALTLRKHLPVASGIGGGSADAAAALRLLNRMWGAGLDDAALRALAAPLGADVPVCVASSPARMQGVGELVSPGPRLPPCGLLLVNPGVPLATPAVFRARAPGFSAEARLPAAWPDAAAMAADLAHLTNDLEAPARALCPEVGEVLAALTALPGALLARMSGSGATCFALFATPAEAHAAEGLLPAQWWRSGGGLYGRAEASLHAPGAVGV